MNYRIALFISHAVAGITGAAAACVSGHETPAGIATLVVVCGVGIATSAGTVVLLFVRGLQRMEAALLAVADVPETRGLADMDYVALRVRTAFGTQRTVVHEVHELLARLNPDVSGDDQLAATRRSDALRTALSRLVRSAAKDVGRILTFGDDIVQSANDTHWGAQEQARTVARTVESVEQLSGNIDRVASNAEAASNAATEVSDAAARGLELVRELIRGMDRIRANVEVGTRKVLSLGDRSREIGSIVETMTAISSRADILALNASIEAVRAGQEGRGFAVVAEEVRKLAERTASASREITGLVESIQLETQDTISTMADERSQVQQEVLRVNEAGVTLEHISRTSTDSADRAREISQATTEQLCGTQNIVQAMQQMAEFAARIQELSKGIRYTTTDLVTSAQDLEERLSPLFHFDQPDESSAASRPVITRMAGRDPSLDAEATADGRAGADELVTAVTQGEFRR